MADSHPQVSIGMPVYNGELYLAGSIESILAQTFRDFELIISDNASTDNTEVICRDFAATDARIKYYRNEFNIGAAKNYNRTFGLSSGEYFKWAAADDLCAPGFLEKCTAVLDAHSEVALCYPKTTLIDEHGEHLDQYDDNCHLRSPRACDRFRDAMDSIGRCNAVHGLIRSIVLGKTSLIKTYRWSDKGLLIELASRGQFHELPERLFFRRLHGGAASTIGTPECFQEFYDPQRKRNITFFWWQLLFHYLATVRKAPVDLIQKSIMSYCVLQFAVGAREKLARESFEMLRQAIRMPYLPNWSLSRSSSANSPIGNTKRY